MASFSSSLASLSSLWRHPHSAIGAHLSLRRRRRHLLGLASSNPNRSSSSSSLSPPHPLRPTPSSSSAAQSPILRCLLYSRVPLQNPNVTIPRRCFICSASAAAVAAETQQENHERGQTGTLEAPYRLQKVPAKAVSTMRHMDANEHKRHGNSYQETVEDPESAEIIFINTVPSATMLNKKEWKSNVAVGRSKSFQPPKIVVLGCMAERLKEKILDADKMVDVVCGPMLIGTYPRLLEPLSMGKRN
ncbi:CDK5RAP1-like protein [Ananas comosus]|uniref:CDK5RAP1-like protein n=1 Tax=Ananas comosus TaxID=4615 RepID=A0A199UJI2_ANACO|nr:CDK5RAP1-like protein [Ananas comosus]